MSKKKMKFKLNPEWMFREPIDFEYNKYTLLGYLKKCEEGFDRMELYPDFVELALHLANIQSLIKENTLLLTNKRFEDEDDEILVKELIPKNAPQIDSHERKEIEKTLKFSNTKIFDMFGIGKSIWNFAYDNLQVFVKKNRNNLASGVGYIIYLQPLTETLFIWEYHIKTIKKGELGNKNYMRLIYEGPIYKNVYKLIEENTIYKESFLEQPLFEIKSDSVLPMKQTLIPMIRRKVMAHIFQSISFVEHEKLEK